MAKTGCEMLDDILGSYKGLTLIYGAAGTGKTTLAKLAAIEYCKTGKIFFLDTESGFNMDRLKQLTPDYREVAKNILLVKAKNFFYQHKAIKELSSVKGVSLVIVDTIGAHYRVYVKKDYRKANAILKKQLELLREISKNVPLLVLTPVYANINSGMISPVGGKILTNRSDSIIRLDRNPRRIIVEKPFNRDALFEIKKEGIVRI